MHDALSALPLSGFLALDKPYGLSSNQALQRVKRTSGTRRGGYLGTLDPLATGLLPVALGEATKFLPYLLESPKTYRVTARLGARTVTGDVEGKVVETGPVPDWSPSELAPRVESRVGESLQIPPMYSALKQGGRPLYALARQGLEVERAARPIRVERVALLEWSPPDVTLEIDCGPGVYIRTWIEDWARNEGTVAHVTALRRLRVGSFLAHDLVGLEALETSGDVRSRIRPIAAALGHWAGVTLDPDALYRIQQGQAVPWAKPVGTELVRLSGTDGTFWGLGRQTESGTLHPVRLIASGQSFPIQK